ncbi:MAG: hypothetical protein M1821_010071, partial [Bathelium mastoideum]
DMNGRNQLPFFEGYIRQYNPEGLGPAECPVFKAETAFAVLDETVPHMTCDIADSIVAGTKVLRSEIVTAATLIKRQLRKPCWDDHHTIPVLVVSFQHDCAARITQAHFDGNRMFIRQSRQLNLAGDEPTDDAYLLMRWMAGSPIGNTTYASSDPVGEAARNQNARIQSDNTVAITV